MKAILCTHYGPPEELILAEVTTPIPKKGEVLIAVRACGVNFPDTLIIQGQYQFKPPLPFSPGSDVAGVITAVGQGVERWQVDDEVVTVLFHGGFAEAVIAPAAACFPKPPQMSFAQAASFMMAYGTSYYALKDRANLQPGETLLVLGASGGVGLTAVELGKIMGARVIAAASTAEKLELCREYGADEGINYTQEDLKERIKELTGGQGADVVYDPVGGSYSEPALRATAWNGRFLVVGFAAGDIPKIPLNLPLLKGCQITGVFWGSFTQREPEANAQNMRQLVKWFTEGKIKPHIHAVYPLAETAAALRELMDRQVRGKVVIETAAL
jgi:NADPH2:quinone reductase